MLYFYTIFIAVLLANCCPDTSKKAQKDNSIPGSEYKTLDALYDPSLPIERASDRALLSKKDFGQEIPLYDYASNKVMETISLYDFKAEIKKLRSNPQFFDWCARRSIVTKRTETSTITESQPCASVFQLAALFFPDDGGLYEKDLLDLGEMNSLSSSWLDQLALGKSKLFETFKQTDINKQPQFVQRLIKKAFLAPRTNEGFLAQVLSASLLAGTDFLDWVNQLPEEEQKKIFSHLGPSTFFSFDRLEEFKKLIDREKNPAEAIDKFLYNIIAIGQQVIKTPGLISSASNNNLYKIPRFLYEKYISNMSTEEKAAYLADFSDDLTKHPLSRALSEAKPPLNAILFFLSIEKNRDRLTKIFEKFQAEINKSDQATKIRRAFRIAIDETH